VTAAERPDPFANVAYRAAVALEEAGIDTEHHDGDLADMIRELAGERDELRAQLRRAEVALRKLSKAVLVVAPTLRKPYPDAPDTSPYEQFVHAPASAAYDLANELRATLAAVLPSGGTAT
jgi:hypothetical protein